MNLTDENRLLRAYIRHWNLAGFAIVQCPIWRTYALKREVILLIARRSLVCCFHPSLLQEDGRKPK